MDRSSQKNLAEYNINTIITNIIAELNNSYIVNKNTEDDERLKNIKNNTNSIAA